MSDIKYSVRVMKKEEIPKVLEVWSETKLQKGMQTLYSWYEVDPEAIHVAVTESGEIISACSCLIHHEDLAFLGLYVAREKYRGKGFGYKVWKACLEHVKSMNVVINAVPDKFELYRDRGGFPLVETEWAVVVNETTAPEDIHPEALSNVPPNGVDIQEYQDILLPSILEYDHSLMGYKRDKAIELNCKEKDSLTIVATIDGACVGWGSIKLTFLDLAIVGPLYADDARVAEVLLRRLITDYPHRKGLSVMTISSNAAASEIMKKVGCKAVEECPRLYRRQKLDVDVNKVFAHFNCNFSPF